ncbi:MAG: hypothetical protein EU544_04150 [Promethearchaeota archaeon]|nr:MAG: hypothetical protein EU544_04150 [Candidatus Lokiarchaeota archaeon]
MINKKIHVIGYDEAVLLLGLLGIEGTIVENQDIFMNTFKKLIKDGSIGMIIIAMDLPESKLEFIKEFKMNNRRPFVFLLPDIFNPNIDRSDFFLNQIQKSLGKIIGQG